MSHIEAIMKATKIAYTRGASVRFGLDNSIYVGFISGTNLNCLFRMDASRGYLSIPMGMEPVARKSLRMVPVPEPENQEGLE